MTTLDGLDLFASGPCSLRPGPWTRAMRRRAFPGLDGELAIDLGKRARAIVQTGRLQAATAAELTGQIAAIEALIDGRTHVLVDNHGRQFPRVILERFECTTPVNRGRGFWCDYTCEYLQLP